MNLFLVPEIDTQAYMVTKFCRPVDSSNLKIAADAAHSTGRAWSCLHISCQIVACGLPDFTAQAAASSASATGFRNCLGWPSQSQKLLSPVWLKLSVGAVHCLCWLCMNLQALIVSLQKSLAQTCCRTSLQHHFERPQTVSEQLTASTEHSMQTHNNMLHLRLSWLCNPKSYDTGTALSPEGQGLGASGLNRGKC